MQLLMLDSPIFGLSMPRHTEITYPRDTTWEVEQDDVARPHVFVFGFSLENLELDKCIRPLQNAVVGLDSYKMILLKNI